MTITYVNNLGLSEMATGDNSGTWGNVTNVNLELIGQALGHGTRAIANASTDNITMSDGTADDDRALYLKLTGGGQACTVTLLPATMSKVWIMENGTAAALTFTQGSGANVTIPAGDTKVIACTGGAGTAQIVYDVFASLSVVDLKVQDDLTVTDDVAIGGLATVGGTLGVTGIVTASDDVKLAHDGAVLGFGAGNDVTLTHVHDTGLLLNSTMALQFNDASQFINAPSATVLDITATDEIELNATAIDLNGTLDVSGTALVTGVLTTTAATVSNGGGQFNGAINVGVDDTGYDVKFFGATASAYMQWDASTDDLILGGAAQLGIGVTSPESIVHIKDSGNVATTLQIESAASQYAPTINFDGLVGASADYVLGEINAGWDTHTNVVSAIRFESGADTTNKDDGLISFYTSSSGPTLVERFRIAANGSLSTPTLATSNVRLGVNAGDGILSSGNYNTLIGDEAGTAITIADNNVAVGYQALLASAEASNNTAIGVNSMASHTGGVKNVGVGGFSLENSVNTAEQTAVGYEALQNSIGAGGGGGNTALGYASMRDTTTGVYNTALGYAAAYDGVLTGNYNTFVGALAGRNLAGDEDLSTFVGHASGALMTSGENNVILGSYNGNQDGLNIIGSDNSIVLSNGAGTPIINYQAAPDAIRMRGQTAGVNRLGVEGVFSMANGATYNVTVNNSGAQIIHIYDSGSGAGAVYFANYAAATSILAQNGALGFGVTATVSDFNLYKNNNSHTATFQNYSGATRTMQINVIGSAVSD